MRLLIALLIALLVVAQASALEGFNETPEDSWSGRDKVGHFAGGFLVGAFTDLMLDEAGFRGPRWQRLAISIGVSALVGAAKEVSDSRDPEHHDASLKDFAATTAGGALGAVTVDWVIHF